MHLFNTLLQVFTWFYTAQNLLFFFTTHQWKDPCYNMNGISHILRYISQKFLIYNFLISVYQIWFRNNFSGNCLVCTACFVSSIFPGLADHSTVADVHVLENHYHKEQHNYIYCCLLLHQVSTRRDTGTIETH